MKNSTITCGSCKRTHTSVDAVRDCYAQRYDYDASIEGELYGEFAMSWVMGGGRSEDINAAYAMHHPERARAIRR